MLDARPHYFFASAIAVLAFFVAPAAEAREKQIVVIGASNVNGKGVGRDAAYPAKLQQKLRAQGIDARVTNAGVDGETTADIRRRLSRSIPKGTDTVVIQRAGSNDRRHGVDGRANMRAIKQELRARGINVVVAKGIRNADKQRDGIHLSEKGHAKVAQGLAKKIRDRQ